MAKIADKYFRADAWNIIEEGFEPEYGEVAESVFSLANEYMGVRGYFEEGYSGKCMPGSYFNGIYEEKKQGTQGYKGVADITEYMVNSVDWLYTRICADGERLDLNTSRIRDFRRTLDLRSGLLTRSFTWITGQGNELEVEFQRLISMECNTMAVQKIILTAKGCAQRIKVTAGLDFNMMHHAVGKNMWECDSYAHSEQGGEEYLGLLGKTQTTGQSVYSTCLIKAEGADSRQYAETEKRVSFVYDIDLQPDEKRSITKKICNLVYKEKEGTARQYGRKQFLEDCAGAKEILKRIEFGAILENNCSWWNEVWEKADISIEGDEWNQQGIRFCIFQMFQTYHGAVEGTNIGAKGLTGEAYNGNAFWDTETYCLPFFLFHDRRAARNLLLFRYLTLPEAKERAKSLDCKGAFYPVATISGKECCNLWQHASLQMQASTAVAYAVWFYEKMTGDMEFLIKYGLEMLTEICRMLATRGAYTENGEKYGFYGVMGPDEFQMMVNNNFYTNGMAKFTFAYTLQACRTIKEEYPAEFEAIKKKLELTEAECQQWHDMERKMILTGDAGSRIYEQHDGYFKLPHIEVDQIPVEEFPLYNHWSYDRIYRNDMIKQPDVLMLLLLFNSHFDEETLRANYEFYEPRCIHESSLSPSVHSILAAQLGKEEEAYRFFEFATRMDLDNYNRNSSEGLHTTSISAAWMNIVYGFGGLRSDGEYLSLNPVLPEKWKSYSFRIGYMEDVLILCVEKNRLFISTRNGSSIDIYLYGKKVTAGKEAKEIRMPQKK